MLEIIVYVVLNLVTVPILLKFRVRNLTYVCCLSSYVLLIIPSYFVYLKHYSGQRFVGYFVCIGLYQIVLLFFVAINRMPVRLQNSHGSQKWSQAQSLVSYGILACSVLYCAIGVAAAGGPTEWVKIFTTSGKAVSFREVFWREVLPRIPLASMFRFLAKIGPIYVGLRLDELKRVRTAKSFLVVGLLAAILEGTKSALIVWFAPLAVYWTVAMPVKKRMLGTILAIVFLGTVWLAALEAESNVLAGFTQKFAQRLFVDPVHVSMIHYMLFRDKHLWGATNSVVMMLRGGPGFVLGEEALDYDNYVMRRTSRDVFGTAQVYGSMNAPAFVYGWVDFGLLGVLGVGVLIGISLLVLDNQGNKGRLSGALVSILPLYVVILVTSRNALDTLFGPEGIGGLLALELFVGKNPRTASVLIWCWVTATAFYYVVGALAC